jgi:CHAD domain-containing protein
MFPSSVVSPPPYSPDAPVDEAARIIMGGLVENVEAHLGDLETATTVRAVHETRKTCRRLRTALRVFSPYFEKTVLKGYRRGFRQFMQRLGDSRDIAVFLLKMDEYLDQVEADASLNEGESRSYSKLYAHWEEIQAGSDAKVREYLASGRFREFLAEFQSFLESDEHGIEIPAGTAFPISTRHVAPLLIADKVADVRAFDHLVGEATPEVLHRLRIAFKELRYTMEFFEMILGPTAEEAIDIVKELLLHLGDLNDTRIHLDMLDGVEEVEMQPAVEKYRRFKRVELEQLSEEFKVLWTKFETPTWRKTYLEAVASL